MPKFADENMKSHKIGGSTFKFSATKMEALGASEYTLATVVVDVSGSMEPYYKDVEKVLKEVVESCRKSPRADNLMLRVVLFDTKVNELHGFRPLPDCNPADYDNCIPPGGMTSLFDATFTAVEATVQYGADLTKNDYQCNAVVFIISDGMDNQSKMPAKKVAEAIKKARTSEALESIMPVLIGVNTDATTGLNQYLESFKTEADFQQYVEIAKADAKTLAKLGGFISRSMSSSSQALGTGGPSKSLTF